jgi:Zn-dependent protease
VQLPEFTPQLIQTAIVGLIALILSICVHEFGHAFVADRLGDGLPRSQGRVSLNPIRHIDPIGTIVMPLMQFVAPGAPLLGWGKPVLTNPTAYTRRLRMKHGHMLVAAAGPAMNLLFALVVSIALVIYGKAVGGLHLANEHVTENLALLIRLNIVLMFFNLIPLPPLDGGTVLRGFIPDEHQDKLDFLDRYGPFILLALLFSGGLRIVMGPVSSIVHSWFGLLAGIAG